MIIREMIWKNNLLKLLYSKEKGDKNCTKMQNYVRVISYYK